MPKLLPPNLREEIVWFLTPLREFKLPQDRIDLIDPYLTGWNGRHELDFSGAPHPFFERLVRDVPGPQLERVLKSLHIGEEGERQAASLCQRMAQALAVVAQVDNQSADAQPFVAYYRQTAERLATSRYQLDSRFVQLTLLVDQGAETQGVRFVEDSQRGKYDSLNKLLREEEERAFVLLGGPGSGKTTLLRRLQLEHVWEKLETPAGQIPFFVPLNSYRGRGTALPPEPLEWLAAEWQLRQPDLPSFEPLFQKGRFLFLLDGLNEIPHRNQTDYRERISWWQQFVQRASARENTAVFSCRSLDYSVPLGSEAAPVRQIQVGALSPTQIEHFLTLYLGEEAPPVWDTLRRDSGQLTLFATPFFLRLLVDQVAATGEPLASRAALLTGFVRRALYREIVQRRHRLFEPGTLLTANDTQQVIHNRWPTPQALPQQGVLISKLEALAYGMQDGRAANEAGQVRITEESAHTLLAHPLAEEIAAAGVQLNVLDKELAGLAGPEIFYLHQLLQEYFAARIMARKPEPERLTVAWHVDEVMPVLETLTAELAVSDPLPGLPATGWEETTLLAAALSSEPERFVGELMAVNLPLAARCAALAEVAVSSQLVADLQSALLERIGDSGADLRARIVAAEALGELGDPRFTRCDGPHGAYLQPPLAAVAGGVYKIGEDESQYDSEKPAHEVEIAPFEMSLFPVTNAEYALFMEAGGYTEDNWWQTEGALAWRRGEGDNEGSKAYYRDIVNQLKPLTDEAIQDAPNVTPEQVDLMLWLKQATPEELEAQLEEEFPAGKIITRPEFWQDGRFNHPAQPVVGVSWYEARAYCAWLSAQTGKIFTLPTEAEWEAAARGQERRQYAYGEAYDNGRCNTFETHLRRTAPIGVFPGGQTPEGIADLSGNVWEWTTSLFQPYPYDAADDRENSQDDGGRRVLRGGSWSRDQDLARAAFRNLSSPVYRGYHYGFRVVVLRRPPSHHDH